MNLSTIQKLQVITGLVPTSLVRSLSVGKDGEKTVSYSHTPTEKKTILGFDTGATVENLLGAIGSVLVGPITLHKSGKLYRKFAVVRRGTVDYISHEETDSEPGTSEFWSVIRQNIKGQKGDPGEETSTQSTL
jgi:hypothetical protein